MSVPDSAALGQFDDQAVGDSHTSPMTRLIGREVEIAEVTALLRDTRLVTLLGPGGIGKTRLASELAKTARAGGREAAFVDCAPLTDPGLVPATIATALGLRATAQHTPSELIVQGIRGRRFLLVLDNLERLIGTGPVLSGLLQECPRLRLLCTSRVPLHLIAERTYEVPPMPIMGPTPPSEESGLVGAEALFVERASRASPSFTPTSDELADISEICRRLDGMPLAIELAAARMRHLSPTAMLARLEDPLPLLTGGPADAPARHRTLRSTIAWSHELLETGTARVFAALCVFAGSFSLHAAEAVGADDGHEDRPAMLDRLSGLVDHSLLRTVPSLGADPRFSMLDTIREFGSQQLADRSDLERRHARYYLEVAEAADAQADGPDQVIGTRAIAQDIENIRVALGWAERVGDPDILLRLAAALGTYWVYQGDLREGARWLDAALASNAERQTISTAKVMRRAARIATLLGDRGSALAWLESSLELCRELEDADGEAEALCWIGMVKTYAQDLAAARDVTERGLIVARRAGSRTRVAQALHYLAIISMLSGEESHGRALYEEAIAEARLSGNRRETAIALVNLGDALMAEGRVADAVATLSEGIGLIREVGAVGYLGWANLTQGLALLELGELEPARQCILDGARLARSGTAIQDLITAVEIGAHWLGTAGAHREALLGWAAASRAREVYEIPLPPHDHLWLDSGVARDRAALRIGAAEETWSAGRSMILDDAADEVLHALWAVPETTRTMTPNRVDGPSGDRRYALTPRETEVLALLAQGRSDGEIAAELYISPKTASVHVANIKGKLGASSRVETVTRAIRLGLAEPGAREEEDW